METSPVIWLVSYPRSGNTLLRRLIHDATGWDTYSIYPDEVLSLKQKSLLGHVPLLREHWIRPNWEPLAPPPYPMFVKSHEHPVEGDQRQVVRVVRDGRDVCVSYYRYMRANRKRGQPSLDQVIEGNTIFGSWSTHIKRWFEPEMTQPATTVYYESMLQFPLTVVESVISFSGADTENLAPVKIPNIKAQRAENPKFFRRGGSWWREVMTEAQHDRFWELHGEAMDMLGYER